MRWMTRTLSIPPNAATIHCETPASAYFCARPVTASVVKLATNTQCSTRYGRRKRRTLRSSLMTLPLAPVEDAPCGIGDDEHHHHAQHARNEDLVEQIDEVHERRVLTAGRIVAEPGRGKVLLRARMTLLACRQQVLLDVDRAGRISRREDVVHAMAVDTHRLVGLLARDGCLEQDRLAVEIGQVCLQQIGRASGRGRG